MACVGVRMPTKLSLDIDAPRYDQTTYWGRAQHFFETTNPVNIFASSHQLDAAKELVLRYRQGEVRDRTVTEEDLWRAKTLYNSAFHPDTGEKMFLPGRMSAQVRLVIRIIKGSFQHGDYWLHDDFLQDHSGCHLLAMVQSKLQCPC